MINSNELYYLNNALDGDDIYGIASNRVFDIKATIKSLKEKQIINENGELNDLSYLILKNLEQYKKSKEYIWINDIALSCDNSNYLIFFKKYNTKENNEEFMFKKTTKELMLLSLVKEYEFLKESNIVKEIIDYISLDDFIEKYIRNISLENRLFIKKVSGNSIKIYNIYYKENEFVYKYNVLNESRILMSAKEIRKELAQILGISMEDING